jgi:mono/diheme cytochrome c family protein
MHGFLLQQTTTDKLKPAGNAVMLATAVLLGLFAVDAGRRARSQPPAGRPQTPPGAAALYQRFCQRCHGEDGSGGLARDRMEHIPDFTRPAWQARRSDAQLRVSILDGKDGAMPPFRGRVDDRQARDLVAYTRAFGPARPPAADPALDDFRKRLRQLEAQLAEIDRQLRELAETPTTLPAVRRAGQRQAHR